MNYLKIVSPGFEDYTGNVGGIEFLNSVSETPVPPVIATRLAAAMAMIFVDQDGNELEDASIAHKLVADAEMRAPVIEELDRQSASERKSEDVSLLNKASVAPVERFYTEEELEALIKDKGIKGLREVGDAWGVADRSAMKLLEKILAAQSAFLMIRDGRIAEATRIEGEPEPELKSEFGSEDAPSETDPDKTGE